MQDEPNPAPESTLPNVAMGEDSKPWHDIASHSTDDDQAWFWTPEWQAAEMKASAEIQQGQLSRKLRSAQEIIQHLNTP